MNGQLNPCTLLRHFFRDFNRMVSADFHHLQVMDKLSRKLNCQKTSMWLLKLFKRTTVCLDTDSSFRETFNSAKNADVAVSMR